MVRDAAVVTLQLSIPAFLAVTKPNRNRGNMGNVPGCSRAVHPVCPDSAISGAASRNVKIHGNERDLNAKIPTLSLHRTGGQGWGILSRKKSGIMNRQKNGAKEK